MSDIQFGKALKTGSAVPDTKLSVGGGIRLGGVKVSGGVDIGGGGSAPVVEARWGQIEGNIGNQSDLMAALNEKLTTPSGTNGQFMSLVDGVWTAVHLPTYEGGVE